MALEIERKFLVKNDAWRDSAPGIPCRQGYFSGHINPTVRIRILGEQAFLTIKTPNVKATRVEYEYQIPVADAAAMLDNLCAGSLIEKIRYRICADPVIWEIDEFLGDNLGLIIAEVELQSESQNIVLPDWIGEEVTGDPRYFNQNLVNMPFNTWKR